MAHGLEGTIGLALGSGAARGWAHVGVIQALEEAGLSPRIVCGSSSGALVGAFYVADRVEALERWGRQLDWRQVVGYFDLSLRGGLITARKLFEFVATQLPDRPLSALERRFATVATQLETGREVWLRDGSLLDSVRASIALPGLITPVKVDGRWLVDGGLVNPVPVSLCRAMGADSVVAVDLNTGRLGRRSRREAAKALAPEAAPEPGDEPGDEFREPGRLQAGFQGWLSEVRQRLGASEPGERDDRPSIYEVIANSINIMQVHVTRSRMAGDPPDLLVAPRLGHFALLDFDRADEAIAEGRRAVARALAAGAAGNPDGDALP